MLQNLPYFNSKKTIYSSLFLKDDYVFAVVKQIGWMIVLYAVKVHYVQIWYIIHIYSYLIYTLINLNDSSSIHYELSLSLALYMVK